MSEAKQVFELPIVTDGYVYKLAKVCSGMHDIFAAISSDDRLSFFKIVQESLELLGRVQAIHTGVTCMQAFDEADPSSNLILTAGRDGLVKVWPGVVDKPTKTLKTARLEPISALACSSILKTIAGGTDTDSEKTGDVAVYLWSLDQNDDYPKQAYTEVHSNSITAILFHPCIRSQLITASTDSLINIVDIDTADEDSAVVSTATHDAAIHHMAITEPDESQTATGFVQIWAVSHDERASCYALDHEGIEECSGSKVAVKDLSNSDYTLCARSRTGSSDSIWICVGSNKPETCPDHRVSIVALQYRPGHEANMTSFCHLPGAHGEEVVRDVWWEPGSLEKGGPGSNTLLTAGEDGMIKLWVCDFDSNSGNDPRGREDSHAKRRKKESKRYKPY